MSRLASREPALHVASLMASGQERKLGWVDSALTPESPPYRYGAPRRGHPLTVRGASLCAQLPPSALEGGDGTSAWEALALLLAPAEWAVATRGLCWTPLSPRPQLLARLVESYGVPRALHRDDPAALARLAAGLPAWRHRRGTLDFARDVLAAVDRPDDLEGLTPTPSTSRIVIHAASAASPQVSSVRVSSVRVPSLRVSEGFACVLNQPSDDPRLVPTITLPPHSSAPFDRALLRLLPVWAVAGASAEPTP